MKIAIVLGSTREGRVSKDVGYWVLKKSESLDVEYEVVDIADFDLPFYGTSSEQTNVSKWNQTIEQYDGFIFIVPEYNHSIPGVLKNALDSARDAWADKSAGIVSYGSAGGARAAEHLRGILSELQIASVRSHILLSLFDDFENFSTFTPRDIHNDNLKALFHQTNRWARVLKSLRSEE